MKFNRLLLGFILLIPFACTKDNVFAEKEVIDEPAITSLNGTWKVVSFEDLNRRTIEYPTQQNTWGHDFTITFDDTTAPHKVTGKVAANSVAGEFEYVDTRSYKLMSVLSTMVGEPVWGDKFRKAIMGEKVNFIINNNQLRIFYVDNGNKSVTLEKQ